MANKHDVQLRTQLLEKLFPTVETIDNLDSDNANRPLSARQGKVLKELIKSGGGGSGLSIEVVETLPPTGNAGILYLVPKSSYLKEENKYDEYIWVESTSKYELIGSFSTDLDINELKKILGEISQINVATLSNNGINDYVTTGTYRVYGERINDKDGLPILNSGNGHTVEGTLRVYDSSIAGTGKDTDKVVTQILSMSNRTGGDGHIWIRTGQGSNKDNLTWGTWEKLQGIFEKNTITNISELNTFTTNGMYSCMYTGPYASIDGIRIYDGATLLIIVINGYMASSVGQTPQLTQSIILTQPGNNTNYIFTRHATFLNDSWTFNDNSNIVLGSALITDVNIGTANPASSNARINIGTAEASRVNINNAFIGDTISRESNSESVIIKTGVNIKENTIIGNNVTIGNYNNIGDHVTIGTNTTIERNTYIKKECIKVGSIFIGTKHAPEYICYIGTDVSINNNTSIGTDVNIGESVYIGDSVSIGRSASIGQEVNIGERVNIKQGFNVERNIIRLRDESIGTAVIIFNSDNITFKVEGKTATLQLT